MKINGELIAKKRKELGLTQKELANGICNQATISVIEKKHFCNSIQILDLVCQRLGLTFDDVIEKTPDEKLRLLLDKVNDLCSETKHQEANELLNSVKDVESISNKELKGEVYYYLGITNLVGFNEIDKALFFFYEVYAMDIRDVLIKSLAINGIGVCYLEKEEISFAKTHFDKSIELIEETSNFLGQNVCKVFYNTAKFYSIIKDYKKADELCDKGIQRYKEFKSTIYLDYLYYEKGYNAYYLNDSNYRNYYIVSEGLADFNDNKDLVQTIHEDLKTFAKESK